MFADHFFIVINQRFVSIFGIRKRLTCDSDLAIDIGERLLPAFRTPTGTLVFTAESAAPYQR